MIYITEISANSDNNFPQTWESILMVGYEGSDAGQHLKAPYWNRVLFFKWVTFSIPKLNMTLYAYITHITQSNNS